MGGPCGGAPRRRLEKTRPESNKRYTDSGKSNDERELKHRDEKATRTVPIPPELVTTLRAHIDRHGVAGDGRPFRTRTGQTFPRLHGLDGLEAGSLLRLHSGPGRLTAGASAVRPAAVSLWLNAGVHAPEVAERAGHGVDVLLKVYAKCIDGQHEVANKRILEALTT